MKRYITIAKAMLKKKMTEVFRYKLELVSGIIFLVITMVGIILGSGKLTSDSITNTGQKILSGFFIFFMTNYCINTPSNECSTASNQGNLETIVMFPIPLHHYIVLQVLFLIISNVLSFIATIIITSLILKIPFFNPSMISLIPFYIISIFGGLGMGLALAGLQLLYKKVGYIISLTAIFMSLALAYLPSSSNLLLEMLPMKSFSSMLKNSVESQSIPSPREAIILVISSVLFYALGVLLFKTMLKKAKVKGSLGVY